jgi:hypothetical protein
MHDLVQKIGVINLVSLIFGIVQWVNPNWDIFVKLSVSAALLGLVAIDRILSREGRGFRLYLHTFWGALQGAVLGYFLSASFFSDPIYEAFTISPGNNSLVGDNSLLSPEPIYLPTDKTKLSNAGYGVVMGCGAIGGMFGLCSKLLQFYDEAKVKTLAKNRIFIILCLVAVIGASVGGYALGEQRGIKENIEDTKKYLEKIPAGSADGVLMRDAHEQLTEILQRRKLIMYVGFFASLTSLAGCAIFAASLIGDDTQATNKD